MDEQIYARCLHPIKHECESPQLVVRPTYLDGRLISHCRHCHGRLIELSAGELAEIREAQNKLNKEAP